MKYGEGSMGEMSPNDDERLTPAYFRRNYLMDMYRFFNLFHNRQPFFNPFTRSGLQVATCFFFCSDLFKATP